ncbi:MAG: ATP-binding cassette domain-containing protein [Caldilineaceae bacterium]
MPVPQRRAPPLRQLTATDLTYHHADGGRGITGIDLQLSAGSFTVITGRVGAGKTTLLRVLLGLLPKQAGEIRWNGALVADPANFFTPPQSAYTAQTPRLFSDTLAENILMGQVLNQAALDQAIHTAVLAPDLATLEQGLATRVGARGVRLSGGQVQRAAATRMLLAGSAQGVDLLVFDDLSSALDVETEALLWERLFAHPHRPACLVVSHRPAALQRADQIIVLNEGKVEAVGSWGELQSRLNMLTEFPSQNGGQGPSSKVFTSSQ